MELVISCNGGGFAIGPLAIDVYDVRIFPLYPGILAGEMDLRTCEASVPIRDWMGVLWAGSGEA